MCEGGRLSLFPMSHSPISPQIMKRVKATGGDEAPPLGRRTRVIDSHAPARGRVDDILSGHALLHHVSTPVAADVDFLEAENMELLHVRQKGDRGKTEERLREIETVREKERELAPSHSPLGAECGASEVSISVRGA